MPVIKLNYSYYINQNNVVALSRKWSNLEEMGLKHWESQLPTDAQQSLVRRHKSQVNLLARTQVLTGVLRNIHAYPSDI